MPTIKKHNKPWKPLMVQKQRKDNASWAFDSRYHTTRWRNYRKIYLKQNRLCVMCKEVDKIVVATVVDHIKSVSQGGDFWGSDKHQPLCLPCNIRKIRKK